MHDVSLKVCDIDDTHLDYGQLNEAYHTADACILVYDISDAESFERIDELVQEFQLNHEEQYQQVPQMLLGNKCDEDEERRVPRDEAEEYARAQSMMFVEVSCLTAHNMNKAFAELVSSCVDYQQFVRIRRGSYQLGSSDELEVVSTIS